MRAVWSLALLTLAAATPAALGQFGSGSPWLGLNFVRQPRLTHDVIRLSNVSLVSPVQALQRDQTSLGQEARGGVGPVAVTVPDGAGSATDSGGGATSGRRAAVPVRDGASGDGFRRLVDTSAGRASAMRGSASIVLPKVTSAITPRSESTSEDRFTTSGSSFSIGPSKETMAVVPKGKSAGTNASRNASDGKLTEKSADVVPTRHSNHGATAKKAAVPIQQPIHSISTTNSSKVSPARHSAEVTSVQNSTDDPRTTTASTDDMPTEISTDIIQTENSNHATAAINSTDAVTTRTTTRDMPTRNSSDVTPDRNSTDGMPTSDTARQLAPAKTPDEKRATIKLIPLSLSSVSTGSNNRSGGPHRPEKARHGTLQPAQTTTGTVRDDDGKQDDADEDEGRSKASGKETTTKKTEVPLTNATSVTPKIASHEKSSRKETELLTPSKSMALDGVEKQISGASSISPELSKVVRAASTARSVPVQQLHEATVGREHLTGRQAPSNGHAGRDAKLRKSVTHVLDDTLHALKDSEPLKPTKARLLAKKQ